MTTENRTQRMSLLRGLVTEIPGLTAHLSSVYQPLLVGIGPGQNLKTINGQSLLGEGNIAISVDLSAYATTAAVAAGYAPISHTHTASQITDFAEAVDDEVATLLQAGTDVTVTYNDAGNTLTIGLGANVPRLNAANTFTQTNTFSSGIRGGANLLLDTSNTLSGQVHFRDGAGNIRARVDMAGGQLQSVTGLQYGPGFAGMNTSGVDLEPSMIIGWRSALFGSFDTRLVRNATGPTLETRAAGGLRVCNADGSAFSSINAGSVIASALVGLGVYTVATLPSASANPSRIATVTDSSVTTNGSAVAGGGSNRVLVFSNGTTWDVVVA